MDREVFAAKDNLSATRNVWIFDTVGIVFPDAFTHANGPVVAVGHSTAKGRTI